MQISEEPLSRLADYARIPAAFLVDRIFEVTTGAGGPSDFVLTERELPTSYVKDYDAIPGNRPTDWVRQLDLANCGLLAARLAGEHVGGALLAFQTPGFDLLEGRRDVAALWDIRVAPDSRRQGVAAALFAAAAEWARERGCRRLRIETQNINVPACRFYARQGCLLESVNRLAYPAFPDEIQLLWELPLGAHGLPA